VKIENAGGEAVAPSPQCLAMPLHTCAVIPDIIKYYATCEYNSGHSITDKYCTTLKLDIN